MIRRRQVSGFAVAASIAWFSANAFAQDSGLSETNPPEEEVQPDSLPFGGISVRFGYGAFSLSAGDVPVVGSQLESLLNDINQGVTAWNAANPTNTVPLYAVSDLDLANTVFNIIPSFHLGGDGYFFRLDLPIGISSELFTLGLGLYPINYGYYISDIQLMPYVSLGLTLNGAVSKQYTDSLKQSHDTNAMGAIVQLPRLALGAKYRPLRRTPVNFGIEIGYSPISAGLVADFDRIEQFGTVSPTSKPPPAASLARGGFGNVFDLAVYVEWM